MFRSGYIIKGCPVVAAMGLLIVTFKLHHILSLYFIYSIYKGFYLKMRIYLLGYALSLMTYNLFYHAFVYACFCQKRNTSMPLRYNNDKRKKPLFSRGSRVCRHLFNSFSKLKSDEKNIKKRRLFH